MATGPKSGHIRADSVTDGVVPISKTLATVQSFYAALSSLTSENGFQALTELVELLPQRENEIKAKDDTIQELHAKLAEQEKAHDDFTQKQLSKFEDRYDDWGEEVDTLQEKVDEQEAASKEKDTELTALRKSLEENKSRNGDLEKECTKNTERLKELNQQIGDLETKLQNAHADADNRLQELKKLQTLSAGLEKSLGEEVKKCQNLNEDAKKMRDKFKDLAQHFVKIKELDLPETTNRIEALWKSTIHFVGGFAAQDLSDAVLQSDWTKFRDNEVFKHRIPLPQSNSEVAKTIRGAIILGALARLIDNVVFQPTFLFNEDSGFDSGLRDVLRQQASVDPTKERYIRRILLSMFPEEQETNSKEGVDYIVDELLDTVNVRVLLTPETIPAFEAALERIIAKFQEEWKIIQRGKQKLEPSFATCDSTDRPWHVFDMQVADAKEGKRAEAHSSISNMEGDIVIIPRVYLIEAEVEPSPVTHGCVLRKAHLEAAEEEIRKDRPSAPFARPTPSRHRSRTTRAASDAAPGAHRGDHFLSQVRGATNS